ncbi:Stf0 family sulfotransferase [Acuticoccus mangrovi]|uniref:Sulfotransferase domain-containing protein n=1 Tax=Acuticoccus mangrovi TaxID=2796142 RepID=A0A934IG68_9HYPH|nr:Stf0 family sulfotransferase [Acuticoccus mangrovi]MBJ3774391.1 sulfotransferase domain-containing protein [Acuticoccus mangrovi]
MTVICMTPRSGSSYLGSVLRENGFGTTQEHFRIVGGSLERDAEKLKGKSYEGYFREKVQRLTENGYFSVKLDWPQFVPLYFSSVFATYLNNANFVYLTRSDILAQAISRYVATVTGYFHTTNEGGVQEGVVPFDYEGIRKHLDYLVTMQGDWERFFASEGLLPVRITYEEVATNPTEAFAKIAQAIGAPVPENVVTKTEFGVTRTSENERLRKAFVAEHRQRMRKGAAALAGRMLT